ncbi:MAG: PSD1 and planctomycete cytochrome C domain-containing protein [Deltaproteobacteria bacterium]|nr:PSD1 and planctomycete cytochrome C domain-containing protein [Deltaproteobacteria bacterium]
MRSLCLIGVGVVAGTLAGPAMAVADVSYDSQVRPILSARCFKCHGFDPGTRRSGLRLDTFEGATKDEAAVVPGKPHQSELIKRVLTKDPDDRMPPNGEPLTPSEVAILQQWISEGAHYTQHWAYAPVVRPPLPKVKQRWGRNPIDRFILARLEAAGRLPSPPASPAILLRRLYLDLSGLPPTVEQVKAFEQDPSFAHYEAMARRLLNEPTFGEHWARWWLDLARYAESTGYSGDFLHTMWPYRDWVVNALNAGMRFDRFSIEQVAGDLLAKPTPSTLVATAFFRAGAVTLDGGNKADEIQWMMARDRTNTTATVWLGATMECAQCHTHKYDPYTQKEYYQLAAYFRSNAEEVISLGYREAVKRLYGATVLLDSYPTNQMSEDELATKATDVAKRILFAKRISDEIVQGRRTRQDGEPDYVQLAKDINDKESDPLIAFYDRYAPYRLWIMKDRATPRPCTVLQRGDYTSPGETVTPGTPASLHPLKRRRLANRLELAQWLVSANNPLTPRVIVNRFWNELFGRGIVTTTEDFGHQGALPSHPELLDWLASEFVLSGWDIKGILLKLVTSETYRQSSDRGDEDVPEELFAFGPRHRLTAEGVRDNLLAISGLLERQRGGPPVFPPQPDGLWKEIFQSSRTDYPTSTGREAYRRSLYVIARRGSPFPMFTTFDAPARDVSTTKRLRSNTPLQALALMNEPMFVEAARAFAKRMRAERGDDVSKITWGFRTAVARAPTTQEVNILAALLTEPKGSTADEDAWFNVAHALLNLDETIVKR